MTEKVFSWLSFLMVFSFFLHSCVHDELYSASDPTSKEYHSKSLWKEDEVYITNVMKVYNKHENEIQKDHGTPLWEYAMTMDKFDESYLLVPVRKEGEITEVLEVPRFGKKIYFKYTTNEDRLSFFRDLLIETPKKALPTSLSNNTSKIICVTRTVSMWYPDNESNPNGSGHWGSTSYTQCYDINIDTFENPDDGSGGGGYDYPPVGGGWDNPMDSTIMQQNPCEKAKPSITNANNILKNNNIQQKMDAVLKGKVNETKEWAVAVGQKPDGSYEVTPAVEQNQYSGSVPSSQLTSAYIGDGHSHSGTPGVPSAGDLYGMLEIVAVNPNFGIRFVYGVSGGNTEVYSLVLNDQAAAIQFLATYPRSENYDPLTHSFKRGKLDDEIVKIKSMYGANATKDSSGHYYDAKALGLAYIFDNLNAGISLSKVDTNGNLKKINASIESVGSSGGKAVVSECP